MEQLYTTNGGGALHVTKYPTTVVEGTYEFWKVMEIDNAIFQDLEGLGKKTFF